MTIATYTELRAQVLRKLRRPDLAADVPAYIAAAEDKLNSALRTAYQIARATTTLDEEWERLPADCLDIDTIQVVGPPPRRVDYLAPAQFLDTVAGQAGVVAYYTVIGREMRFAPIPSGQTLEISYFAKIPALSDSNPSNWLLERSSTVYLYGALVEGYTDLREPARAAEYLTLLTVEIDRLNKERATAFGAAGPLRVRTAARKP